MKSKQYLFAIAAAICLIGLVACASSNKTVTEDGTKGVPAEGEIQFDFADAKSLPVISPGQKKVLTLKNFPVGIGRNRMLIVGVLVEERGKEDVGDMAISSVTFGDRTLTPILGSEVQFSQVWRGAEYFTKMALYCLIDPPSGTYDIKVTYAGPVRSGNVGAVSLYNVQQAAPQTLVTNKQYDQKKIITTATTKNDGAWVVDMVGCGHKSKLKPKTQDHTRRFNAQEKTGGKSSLTGGTLPVIHAGEVTLHWAQHRRSINRLAHVAVEIAPYK